MNKLQRLLIGVLFVSAGAGGFFYWSSHSSVQSPSLQNPSSCDPAHPFPRLTFWSRPHLLEKLNGKEITARIQPTGRCFQKGEIPLLLTQSIAPQLSIGENLGVGVVASITPLAAGNYPPDILKVTGHDSIPAMMQELPQWWVTRSGYLLVRFTLNRPLVRKHDRSMPDFLNFAEILDPGGLDAEIKKGASLIDVRSPDEFSKGHHPDAINIPYLKGNPEDWDPSLNVGSYQSKDRFFFELLPANTFAPLIFTGSDSLDLRPVRALALSSLLNRKNLKWLRTGESGRTKTVLATMDDLTGISVVNAVTTSLLRKKGAHLIDVRSARTGKNAGVHIPGSLGLPYQGSNQPSSLLSMNLQSFLKNHESFPLHDAPKDKDAEIVILGEDEFDWAAPRAAVWMKESGWNKVHWLRGGIAAWLAESDGSPAEYPLEKSVNDR